jgi:hypothetical protein
MEKKEGLHEIYHDDVITICFLKPSINLDHELQHWFLTTTFTSLTLVEANVNCDE